MLASCAAGLESGLGDGIGPGDVYSCQKHNIHDVKKNIRSVGVYSIYVANKKLGELR